MASSSDLTDFKRYLVGACGVCASGSSGGTGPTGPTGPAGIQGPALFTLTTAVGSGVTLTSNSITASSGPFIVNTVEPYYTAFITFKLNSGTPTVGFVAQAFINTFAFAFEFYDIGTYSLAYNGGGSVGSYTYSLGDFFTIALTTSTCKFFQNGTLIYSVITNPLYLNVFGRFYGANSASISNISYGYLTDAQSSVLAYTYNTGSITNVGSLYFLNLTPSGSGSTVFVNSDITNDSYVYAIPGIYGVTVTCNSTTTSTYYIYYSTNLSTWTQVGNSLPGNTSSSSTVIINLSIVGYIGIASSDNNPTSANEFNISVERYA